MSIPSDATDAGARGRTVSDELGSSSPGARVTDLRYPIGKFVPPSNLTAEDRTTHIEQIAETPARLRAAVSGLSAEQFHTPYRPGGWTVQQVVHHLPDSHLNAYTRFKLALTEDVPAIKTYDEARWAELSDSRTAPPGVSLALLQALHERWVLLLRSLSLKEFSRAFKHPEWGAISLERALALYAWHGRHHVAHITSLRDRMGWG